MAVNTELLAALANMGLNEVVDQLQNLEPKNDLERLTLDAMVEVIGNHGTEGVGLALDMLGRLSEGESLSQEDILAMGLRASSDLVAEMQRVEKSERKAAADFAAQVGAVLGPLLKGIVVSLV